MTHKPWAAPDDVDVTIPVIAAEWNGLPPKRRHELHSWFLSNGDKVQPMAGLVDSFVFDQANGAVNAYWSNWWPQVMDQSKQVVPGAVKGYLEVAI